MRPYHELPEAAALYLEDSYVLGIVAEPGSLRLEADLVLTDDHPQYRSPKPGERYCYRRGTLRFAGVSTLTWSNQGVFKPATDATGEIDYGSVDVLEFEGRRYRLEGDFGVIDLEADALSVELTADA